MSSIPASLFSVVTPSVLSANGNAVDCIGLFLTTNVRVPVGVVLSFPNSPAVSAFFGPSSTEAVEAAVYFAGYTNALAQPAALLFAQYNTVAASAYLRGGNISGLALTTLQSLSGSLDVTIDGYPFNAASINLSAATSFSSAAALIAAGLNGSLPTEASVTGSIAPSTASVTASIAGFIMSVTAVGSGQLVPGAALTGSGVTASTQVVSQLSGTTGGVGQYVVSISQTVASTTIAAAYGTLTVTNVGSGALAVGQTLAGAGVTSGTLITGLGTGTGGDGTYYVTPSQTEGSSETITSGPTACAVSYDSVSGAFIVTSGITGAPSSIAFATGTLAASLLLTSATGATLSQGAAPATPSAFMTALTSITMNWVTFTTLFDPDFGSGNAQKQLFAAWNTLQEDSYVYVALDKDITPTESVPATGSLGYILQQNGNSGTCLVYESGGQHLAAFVCGAAASINFNAVNGRMTFAFKNQAGLVASVTTGTAAVNLGGSPQVPGSFGNGYNYYGAVGAANDNFLWFQRGTITGPFNWLDSYINQVVLNSSFQVAMLTFLGSVGSVPFNQAGASLIEQALQPVILQFGNPATGGFGAFAPGAISAAQVAQVNNQAGTNIATALQTQGYYLQVLQQSAAVRESRGPWSITFWYLDRGSVQSLDLSSIAVQ